MHLMEFEAIETTSIIISGSNEWSDNNVCEELNLGNTSVMGATLALYVE